jgi:hypothetical protein
MLFPSSRIIRQLRKTRTEAAWAEADAEAVTIIRKNLTTNSNYIVKN